MEILNCPLLYAQLMDEASTMKCIEEKCAWFIRPDKDFGQPECAITKLGKATLIKETRRV